MLHKQRNFTFVAAALTLLFSIVLFAHPGRKDDNGGHLDRSTGLYHCHATACVEPSTAAPIDSVSVVSFNIQFLGNSTTRDAAALA